MSSETLKQMHFAASSYNEGTAINISTSNILKFSAPGANQLRMSNWNSSNLNENKSMMLNFETLLQIQ